MRAICMTFVTVFILCGIICPALAPGADSIAWHTYDDGLALGKVKEKQILVHFYAPWCYYCRKMAVETFRDKDVASYIDQHFIPVRVDIDRERKIASQYGVRAVPTTWFLSETGKTIDMVPGFVPEKRFLSTLKKVTSSARKKTP